MASATAMTPEATQLFALYQEKQDNLAMEFKRALANLTGTSLPSEPRKEIVRDVQDSSSNLSDSEDCSNNDETDGHGDSSSSDEDPPLPPAADPSNPLSPSELARLAKGGRRSRKNESSNLNAKKRSKSTNGVAKKKLEINGITTNGVKNGANGVANLLPNRGNLNSYSGPPLSPGSVMGMKSDGSMVNGDVADNEKKARVRASKMEFKRLDEVYNKAIHDFYLAESSTSPSAKDDKWEEYIFVVRRRFDYQNKFLKSYVDIKSVDLRDVLREVLKDVSGIGLREDKPTIEPSLLFNYLPQLEAELIKERNRTEKEQNKTLIQHLTILTKYIESDYAPTVKRLYPLLQHQEITFDLLWALFLPNTLVHTTCAGSNESRCLKLDWGEQKESLERGKFFQLDCHYIDYDGKTFGKANAVLEIEEFRGARRIDSLGVFPLAYHDEEEKIREKLIERGRKFLSLKGMHYKFYKGLAFFKRKKGVVRLNVHGRVMIDPSTFRRINPNYRMSPVKETLHSSTNSLGNDDDSENENDDDDDYCGGGRDDDEEAEINTPNNNVKSKPNPEAVLKRALLGKPQRSYITGPDGKLNLKLLGGVADMAAAKKKLQENGKVNEKQGLKEDLIPEEMTEEELLLCSPTVLGFSFGDKLWAEFAVDRIMEIEFNNDAFDSLVLPEAQKTIVRALVESHTGNKDSKVTFDDVIKGKGKGLVAVLHGRPGVGKTLTAEGISEFLKRPLYMVGAGELGTDPRTLETQLSRILDIAHVWGAVLLLDEADVFLERRSVHDLHRNALVSVFLRLLEYFQGILFLTTNRVETFDEAFQSRIHIALRYNDLDKKAKRVIWKTFLEMVAKGECLPGDTPRQIVSKEELEGLARRQLNGRQIKNTVRTAQALAVNKNENLSMEHLNLVLAVTEGFEHDLKGTGQIESMMSYA
ncbi:uncharacterized protein H6S33_011632 [Morchella sextelata]|uniref:uncharacterized protein n=1 Tax=Morchella sextelata TaxID=1174677 RepID=UPI001D041D2E|nr:uncharacterized protein H6S33_011632 [Morchella sextelata]KAH0611205.1 hypothetical protein H6S33_011632 [Morchella sextelata]